MKYLFSLLWLGICLHAYAQDVYKAPAVKDKKLRTATVYYIGYDTLGNPVNRAKMVVDSFDTQGNLVSSTAHVSTQQPTTSDEVLKESDYINYTGLPNNKQTYTYTYSTAGQLLIMEDKSDSSYTRVTYKYNAQGKQTEAYSLIDKGRKTTAIATKTYDAAGNLITDKMIAGGEVIMQHDSFVYNNKNQLVQLISGQSATVERCVYNTYNDFDSLATKYIVDRLKADHTTADTIDVLEFAYDKLKRLTKTTEYVYFYGNLYGTNTITRTYQPDGTVEEVFVRDGSPVYSKLYNAHGDIIEAKNNLGLVNRTLELHDYNADKLPVKITTINAANRIIDVREFEYTFW